MSAALAEPQEPVGVVTSLVKGGVTWHTWPSDIPDGTLLFAAPPQRPAEPQNPPGCDHCRHPLHVATQCRVCGRKTA